MFTQFDPFWITNWLLTTNVGMNFLACFDTVGMVFRLLLALLACVLIHIKVWQKSAGFFGPNR